VRTEAENPVCTARLIAVNEAPSRGVGPTHHPIRTDELDYHLPPDRIATHPAEPRDSARMLVISRSDPLRLEHRHVSDLPSHLVAGDALVLNTSAVAPARFLGRRNDTGARLEGLFIEARDDAPWLVMLRCNTRLRPGMQIELMRGEPPSSPAGLLELVTRQDGDWLVRPLGPRIDALRVLDEAGRTPLPPYIRRARGGQAVPDELDRRWYQTVYADPVERKSVAAPTAGLHFTPRLLDALAAVGIRRVDVTLHVGPGTFKPITAETLDRHRMHTESFHVGGSALAALKEVRRAGRHIIAVGTTCARTLESLPDPLSDPVCLRDGLRGETDLLIAPPFEFRLVDGLLTNFHLPRSTLLALVAAMIGLDRVKSVYAAAVAAGYRFYSYGDAMLILP
jgi:S-adenosylmethionine:tRNA ribosyltransferase-isomerase